MSTLNNVTPVTNTLNNVTPVTNTLNNSTTAINPIFDNVNTNDIKNNTKSISETQNENKTYISDFKKDNLDTIKFKDIKSYIDQNVTSNNKSTNCNQFKKPNYNPFKIKNIKGIGILILSSIIISIIWGIFGLIIMNTIPPTKGEYMPIVIVLSIVMFIITALSHVALYNRWIGCYFKVDNE